MEELSRLFVCPWDRGPLVTDPAGSRCSTCQRQYPWVGGVPSFAAECDAGMAEVKSYWNEGWTSRYEAPDHVHLRQPLDKEGWLEFCRKTVDAYVASRHVRAVEIGNAQVRGKLVLDIGCGGGVSGLELGYQGARYVGVDISHRAATICLETMRHVTDDGITAQGSALQLPFADGTFDVVFSNGVLHHIPDMDKAIGEAVRVLRPGGRGIIALYSKWSTQFLTIRARGMLRGYLTPSAQHEWMSRETEHAWRTEGRTNPCTYTVSASSFGEILSRRGARDIRFRKNGNPLREIYRLGPRLPRWPLVDRAEEVLEPWLGSMIIASFTRS